MKETMMLKDLDQIRVFAHPLRARIVEAFADKPRTAKQVAEMIGQKPTKLYHHVDALERVGLIELVKTKKKRGTVENYYRTVAKRFSVDNRVFQAKVNDKEMFEEFRSMFTTLLENTMQEINESISERLICPEKKKRGAILTRKHIRTTRDNIEKLQQKIHRFLDDITAIGDNKGNAEYRLTLVFYPLVKKKKRGE
jgi:DNA-binding transcriptional ArsR family regulator